MNLDATSAILLAMYTVLHGMEPPPFVRAQQVYTSVSARTIADGHLMTPEESRSLLRQINDSDGYSRMQHARLWIAVQRRLAWDQLQTIFDIDAPESLMARPSTQAIAHALAQAADQLERLANNGTSNDETLLRFIAIWWDGYGAIKSFGTQQPELNNLQENPAIIGAQKIVQNLQRRICAKKSCAWWSKLGPYTIVGALAIIAALAYKNIKGKPTPKSSRYSQHR